MTFKIINTRKITFIRLKACCAKKDKSSNEILVSIHSGISIWYDNHPYRGVSGIYDGISW